MTNTKRVTPSRKSTRPRSDLLPIRNGFPLFLCSNENLDTLERAFGKKFSESMRKKIKNILDMYFFRSEAALAAPFASDVQTELAGIRAAAEELKTKLFGKSNRAKLEAIKRIEDELETSHAFQAKASEILCVALDKISTCCDNQIAESKKFEGRINGHEEWDNAVVQLAELFNANGLPKGVTANPKPSRFVLFMAEVHRIVPEGAAKPGRHSYGALAQAMKRAVAADKDRRREEMHRECPNGTAEEELQPFSARTDQEWT